MRKAGHKNRKLKLQNAKLLVMFAVLVVLPTSFFIADLISISPLPQNNANGVQAAFVPEASPLFDVKITVLPEYKKAVAGSKVIATVNMKNLGTPGSPIDVELTISIANTDGTIISTYSKDTLAVATQLTVVREALVPSDLKAGTYLFLASAKYNGRVAESYDSFTTTAPRLEIETGRMALYGLLAVLVILIFVAAAILLEHYLYLKHS